MSSTQRSSAHRVQQKNKTVNEVRKCIRRKKAAIREDEHLSKVDFRISQHPGSIKTLGVGRSYDRSRENRKSSTHSKAERLFQIVKRYFVCHKASYRDIAKNMNKFFVLFGCANLVVCIRAGRTEEFSACGGITVSC